VDTQPRRVGQLKKSRRGLVEGSPEWRAPAATIADLWRFYDEHAAQARQHENMRATVSSTLAGIAAAVAALAAVGGLTVADVPAGLVIVLLGVLGGALSIKHYERNRMHTAILDEIREHIDQLQSSSPASARSTGDLRKAGVRKHERSFSVFSGTRHKGDDADHRISPWVNRIRLHLLWLGLPAGVGIVGLLVIVLAIVGVGTK
jgi:hypothetical protein